MDRSIWRLVAVHDPREPFLSAWRTVAALIVFSSAGCVYPADDPTGLEVSWRFFEANEVDGQEGRRVRTCTGMMVDSVDVNVEDQEDLTRRGSFPFACEEGFQTHAEFQTRASDVFIPLRPRDYLVALTARGSTRVESLVEREVDVLSRGLTVELFELVPEPVTWELALAGLDACETVALSLLYADPVATLAHPPRNDEGQLVPTLYRESLETDRQLSLFGTAVECSEDLQGVHIVEGIDRGVYRLEVSVDGRLCAFEVSIRDDASMTLDLASLPCEG
jgi:hypothetical protein